MLLKDVRQTIKEKILLLKTFDKIIKELKEEPPLPLTVFISDKIIICGVKNIDQLHIVRLWLRRNLGYWEDRREQVWHSSGSMLCSFCSQNLPIRIWLETSIEDFPKELQTDKCKIVKLPDTIESHYAYVCEE